uniref:Uncharacterized protein n=1 Tax=Wuchereria bancrofti TaxID=6293 RepID=A0AAF5PJF2_WUCBA
MLLDMIPGSWHQKIFCREVLLKHIKIKVLGNCIITAQTGSN